MKCDSLWPFRLLSIGLLLVTALLFGSCRTVVTPRPTLVVASDLDNMPFAGVAEDGTPIGRDVEMMQRLCERAGFECKWSRMPFDQLLPKVEVGRVDVVCATLGITEERAQRVLFVGPYFDTEIAVVVRVGGREPQSLQDLNRLRVSGAAGTTSQRAIIRHLPGARGVFENKTGGSGLFRLVSREIDAAVMDGPAADKLVTQSDGKLRRLQKPLDRERYALALPKSHAGVAARLQQALSEMQSSGELQILDRRHGLTGN
ncbi:MAG: ABC-type amino acid transport substrate-binding protein [Planctomycetota bacterium]|jgi:ABC-type amino acid transport substrate-binding protein